VQTASDLEVSDLMSRRVTAVAEDDTVSLARQLMLWSGIRHLPVVRDREVVGLLSDRDLLRIAKTERDSVRVGDVMTTPVETIDLEAPVSEASARMAAKKIDCLPVVEDGYLSGIITSTDILAERGGLAHKDRTPPLPTVLSIARRNPVSIRPEESLAAAVRTMAENEIRHLPVVDATRRVVGILSDRDVRAKAGDPREVLEEDGTRLDLEVFTVEDAMTPDPTQVTSETSILEVADIFLDGRIGAIPVVDPDDRLIGIVSYLDLIAYLVGSR
jgi:CBS domain-containing protein